MRNRFVLLVLGGMLVACGAIQPAEMKIASSLRSSNDVADVTGLALQLNGSYTAARYSGTFTRSASGSSWFGNLTQSDQATSSFTLATNGKLEQIRVNCAFEQSSVNIGIVAVDTKEFGYNCTIAGDDPAASGNLRLAKASTGLVDVSGKNALRGSAAFGGVSLQVASVHEAKGSLIPIENPLGYEFYQAGRPVGAINIQGSTPRIYFQSNLSEAEHQAVATTAIALALFMMPPERS